MPFGINLTHPVSIAVLSSVGTLIGQKLISWLWKKPKKPELEIKEYKEEEFYYFNFQKKDKSFFASLCGNDSFGDLTSDFFSFYEQVLKEDTKQKNLFISIETMGGTSCDAFRLANCLALHKGKVYIEVPHFAFSAGTVVALMADKIVVNPWAVLSPIDPMLHVKGLPVALALVTRAFEKVSSQQSSLFEEYCGQLGEAYCDNSRVTLKNLLTRRLERTSQLEGKEVEVELATPDQILNVFFPDKPVHHSVFTVTDYEPVLNIDIRTDFNET